MGLWERTRPLTRSPGHPVTRSPAPCSLLPLLPPNSHFKWDYGNFSDPETRAPKPGPRTLHPSLLLFGQFLLRHEKLVGPVSARGHAHRDLVQQPILIERVRYEQPEGERAPVVAPRPDHVRLEPVRPLVLVQ